ncbi:hypothetical protein HanIR_Chr13g0620371 [Helianthus annuus]|nr:hypothetical protein HanIR_Chr13g0620371 [Helianthus annuus]
MPSSRPSGSIYRGDLDLLVCSVSWYLSWRLPRGDVFDGPESLFAKDMCTLGLLNNLPCKLFMARDAELTCLYLTKAKVRPGNMEIFSISPNGAKAFHKPSSSTFIDCGKPTHKTSLGCSAFSFLLWYMGSELVWRVLESL